MTVRQPSSRPRWVLPFLAALIAALAILVGNLSPASAAATAETRVGASSVVAEPLVGPPEHIAAGQRLGEAADRVVLTVATGVAAKTGASGADDVLNGVRLRAQLTGDEIAGGHAFGKHVGEFPGITTRQQFARHIEDVVSNGVMRPLERGRSAYWQNGTVVIRNPNAVDGGTAFRPTNGYDYFLGLD